MELTALRYCIATARLGTVTAAAEEFMVAPSAVSRAIRIVERELGVALFDRVGRNVIPSRLGQAFLDEAASAIQQIDAAARAVRQRSGVDHGSVRLGFLSSLGAGFIPAVLQRVSRAYRDLTVELAAGSERAVVDWLRTGAIDIAIGVPGMFDTDAVLWEPLYDEELVCAVPTGHVAGTKESVSFRDLAQVRLVLLSADFSVRRIVDDGFRSVGLEPSVVFEGPDVATLGGLVRAGIGIGILPSDAVKRQPDDAELVVVPITGGLVRSIAVGRVRRKIEAAAVHAVRIAIADCADDWRRAEMQRESQAEAGDAQDD